VPTVDEITLGPGEDAVVLWSIDMSSFPVLAEGGSMEIEALRFEVSWLGLLPATLELPLERPITFLGES
jgi:hypothetical protein